MTDLTPRAIIVTATFLSGLSIFCCTVLVPFILMEANQFQSEVKNMGKELKFEFDQTWTDLIRLTKSVNFRVKRQSCECNSQQHKCPVGRTGITGMTGQDGSPGSNGRMGLRGLPGLSSSEMLAAKIKVSLNEGYGPQPVTSISGCPKSCPSPAGPPGAVGKPGIPGLLGITGQNTFVVALKGPNGADGQRGQPGRPGRIGNPGMPGIDSLGVKGAPGQKGNSGIMGPPGVPGSRGKDMSCPSLPTSGSYGTVSNNGCGIAGPSGPRGMPGSYGIPGRHGLPGPQGSKGPTGPDAGTCACEKATTKDQKATAFPTVDIYKPPRSLFGHVIPEIATKYESKPAPEQWVSKPSSSQYQANTITFSSNKNYGGTPRPVEPYQQVTVSSYMNSISSPSTKYEAKPWISAGQPSASNNYQTQAKLETTTVHNGQTYGTTKLLGQNYGANPTVIGPNPHGPQIKTTVAMPNYSLPTLTTPDKQYGSSSQPISIAPVTVITSSTTATAVISEEPTIITDMSPETTPRSEPTQNTTLTISTTSPTIITVGPRARCIDDIRVVVRDPAELHMAEVKDVGLTIYACSAECRAAKNCVTAGFQPTAGDENSLGRCLLSFDPPACEAGSGSIKDFVNTQEGVIISCSGTNMPLSLEPTTCQDDVRVIPSSDEMKLAFFTHHSGLGSARACASACIASPRCIVAAYVPNYDDNNVEDNCVFALDDLPCDAMFPTIDQYGPISNTVVLICLTHKTIPPAACTLTPRVKVATPEDFKLTFFNHKNVPTMLICADECQTNVLCHSALYSSENAECLFSSFTPDCDESLPEIKDILMTEDVVLLTCLRHCPMGIPAIDSKPDVVTNAPVDSLLTTTLAPLNLVVACVDDIRVFIGNPEELLLIFERRFNLKTPYACAAECQVTPGCRTAGFIPGPDANQCLLSTSLIECDPGNKSIKEFVETMDSLIITCLNGDMPKSAATATCFDDVRIVPSSSHNVRLNFFKHQSGFRAPHACASSCRSDPKCIVAAFIPTSDSNKDGDCIFATDDFPCDAMFPTIEQYGPISETVLLTCLSHKTTPPISCTPQPRVRLATVEKRLTYFNHRENISNPFMCALECQENELCHTAAYTHVGPENKETDCLLSSQVLECDDNLPIIKDYVLTEDVVLLTCLNDC